MDLHVLLWQLAVGGLQAASALGHRRLLTVVQPLQSGVPVEEEPRGSASATVATPPSATQEVISQVFVGAAQLLLVQHLQI